MKTAHDIDLSQYPLLALVNTPEELRMLPKEMLPKFCEELRQYLLNTVSITSGHLASGLGVVELTVALHYVYQTPFDNLIWDVGHQAYPHKIITGRRDKMITLRQQNGLHPFPWRNESEYDILNVGHSSTSISAGLGMAIAAQKEGKGRRTVCVIGDGAITAGIAFEGMNHAGGLGTDLLVVLNDNEMSISENVGAINNQLARVLSGKMYTQLKEQGKKVLSGIPPIKAFLKYTEEQIKEIASSGSTLFEKLGFNYIGPVDGHDPQALIEVLANMRNLKGPQFLHILTKKGKGYEPAEKDPISWHGVPQFDPKTGKLKKSVSPYPSYSSIFGDWLCEMAATDDKLVAITPAMSEGSGMANFAKHYPKQFVDVAIAEQHAVTFAAGLAISGLHPIVAIYSTFLQRAYDQVIHDIALSNLPVLFAIDRAGIVGADGPTHQGAFDISFLRCIPNLVIMAPSDENECRQMLYTGYQYNGPAAVRYPRGSGTGATLAPLQCLEIGKAVTRRKGEKVAVLNFGSLLEQAMPACEQTNATVIDMRFIKPLDEDLLTELAQTHDVFFTLEENVISGGAGSAVSEFFSKQNINKSIIHLGLPDLFIPQGDADKLRAEYGLDTNGILHAIQSMMD